jgi:RNA polymerase sigma factor (sigma-70 family)
MTTVNERPGLRPVPAPRFDEVFRAAYREAYALGYRLLGDRSDAEDTAQDAFVKLAADPVLHRPDAEVRAWLRRVVLNVGYNRMRGQRRAAKHVERAGRLGVVPDGDDGPLTHVLRREEQLSVRRTLAALPARQRDCLLLRHSGYSYAEVAATLEIAVGSVGVLLARSERAFRELYNDQERHS